MYQVRWTVLSVPTALSDVRDHGATGDAMTDQDTKRPRWRRHVGYFLFGVVVIVGIPLWGVIALVVGTWRIGKSAYEIFQ